MKYVFFGFLAVVASFTIVVLSSGANRYYPAAPLIATIRKAETNSYGSVTVPAQYDFSRYERALASGCEPLNPSESRFAQTLRCPLWVTP